LVTFYLVFTFSIKDGEKSDINTANKLTKMKCILIESQALIKFLFLFFPLLSICAISTLNAQIEVIQNKNVVVGSSSNAEESAKLQVISKTQGMLFPRMLHAEMEAIVDPVDALTGLRINFRITT